jgi:hypothetical protein
MSKKLLSNVVNFIKFSGTYDLFHVAFFMISFLISTYFYMTFTLPVMFAGIAIEAFKPFMYIQSKLKERNGLDKESKFLSKVYYVMLFLSLLATASSVINGYYFSASDSLINNYAKLFELLEQYTFIRGDIAIIVVSLAIAIVLEICINQTKVFAYDERAKKKDCYIPSIEEIVEKQRRKSFEQSAKIVESIMEYQLEQSNISNFIGNEKDNIKIKEIQNEKDIKPITLDKYRDTENKINAEIKKEIIFDNQVGIKDLNSPDKQTDNMQRGVYKFELNENEDTDKIYNPTIGFDTKGNKFNLETQTLKYIEYMYKNIKEDGYSPSKKDIRENTGCKDIDLIWLQLKKLGIIQVEKYKNVNRSKILKSEEETINQVKKYFSDNQTKIGGCRD